MQQLTVKVKRLNKRSLVPMNFSDRSAIAGTVTAGYTFLGTEADVTEVPNQALGKWYKDRDGYFYWGGGVEEGIADKTVLTEDIVIPKWMTSLGLLGIWNEFNEKGERARIAILDSGFNQGIPDIAAGVKDSKVFFTSVAGTPVSINDNFGHGTHCASLIGGRNKDHITGCAPASSMYIAKICSQGSVRSFSIVADAIKWAIENAVDVISISYGGAAADSALESIINTAVNEHNILVVASIGDVIPNSVDIPCFPALFANCIAVGAIDDQRRISAVTVLSDKTEINAPGDNIPGYGLAGISPVTMTGTSQASAIVAGIAALIVSRLKKLNRDYSVESIKKLIVGNSMPVTGNEHQRLIDPNKIFSNI